MSTPRGTTWSIHTMGHYTPVRTEEPPTRATRREISQMTWSQRRHARAPGVLIPSNRSKPTPRTDVVRNHMVTARGSVCVVWAQVGNDRVAPTGWRFLGCWSPAARSVQVACILSYNLGFCTFYVYIISIIFYPLPPKVI